MKIGARRGDSHRTGAQGDEPHNQKTYFSPIYALPIELLSSIFKFASEGRTSKDSLSNSDLKQPLQFPYDLASVCTIWREPTYWTRIIIFVDSTNPTPVQEAQALFERSGDLPITVQVGRRDKSDADAEENERARAIIEVLKPHVHRCTSIKFDVIYGSSLPSLSRDLYALSASLVTLSLICKVDDGYPPGFTKIGKARKVKAKPKLRNLELHGYTMLDVLWRNSRFLDGLVDLQFFNFSHFDVDNYSHTRCSELLPLLFDALEYPRALFMCTFANVNLPSWLASDGGEEDPPFLAKIEILFLQGLTNANTCLFIDHLDLSSVDCVDITSCSVEGIRIQGPNALSLHRLSDDLTHFLSLWDGNDLLIDECPGLTDDTLEHFAAQVGYFSMTVLRILDCPNFSVAALKRLVGARVLSAHIANGEEMRTVDVTGNGPELSEDDRSWFHCVMDSQRFSWDAVPKTYSLVSEERREMMIEFLETMAQA
ncbi:hypothetical protein NLJ89_g776 [Agrocybe chaxingu]|uniref:F-box domain-containing protein n=1 Tax=Agrocybe chaxingu TaxID=84603 RepID=A0A9W8TG60_9AGAR|nr:hypothetical protein NLJ89_g776 [Agrocybe chaxingu]